MDQPSVGVMIVTVRLFTTGPRNPGVRQKPSVNIGTTKTTGRIKPTETSVKKPVVAGGFHTGAPTRNQMLISPKPTAILKPAFHIK